MAKPNYDFNDPLFQKKRILIRYAKEHQSLASLAESSDVISYEVVDTTSSLNIPILYRIFFNLKTITHIDEAQAPVYGYQHTLELGIPNRYPLEPCTIYMKTDVWHPNIKSDGRFKGKICGNVKGFGKTMTIDQLVLRIGEILQYKNYLAEFVRPYPEDQKVADWVLAYAEPNGIVNRKENLAIDNTPLIRSREEDGLKVSVPNTLTPPPEPIIPIAVPTTEVLEKPVAELPKEETPQKIKITIKKNTDATPRPSSTRSKIVIGKKKTD